MSIKPYFTYGAKASDRDLINSTVNYYGQQKRYFSSLDAEIFIGGERILDINRLDFNYTEQKLPVYGFNSFLPSRIFVGQKIIQGSFVINFTEVGYIAKLLERIDESKYINNFERVGISCDEINSALFKKSFDILVGYGGYNIPEEASLNNTCQILRGVQINGFSQILDTSGEPIYEVYSFIARDVTFDRLINNLPVQDEVSEGKGKSVSYEYGVAESRLQNEVDNVKHNSNENSRYLGVIANVYHDLIDANSSLIKVSFDLINNDEDDIDNLKLTISDNEIGISKTYDFNYYNNTWISRLGKEDTEKIYKKLKQDKTANCLLEFSLKRKSSNEEEHISKNVGMYKNNGY